MKKNIFSIYWYLIPVLFVEIADEWMKFKFLSTLSSDTSLKNPGFLNLAIHKNLGLAFDLPFRVWFIVFISIVLGYFLLEIAYKNRKTFPMISFSCLLIVIGAFGNLFDRVAYGFTVDYLIFFGRSAVNLSDLIIVLGVISLLLTSRKTKSVFSLSN